jgi:hypothetical protein
VIINSFVWILDEQNQKKQENKRYALDYVEEKMSLLLQYVLNGVAMRLRESF